VIDLQTSMNTYVSFKNTRNLYFVFHKVEITNELYIYIWQILEED
jgi:hypothetical protein